MLHKLNLRKNLLILFVFVIFTQLFVFKVSALNEVCDPGALNCAGNAVVGYTCDCGAGCDPTQACTYYGQHNGLQYRCSFLDACVNNPNSACSVVGRCGGECLPDQICKAGTNGQPNYCDTARTQCTPSCTGTGCGSAVGCPEGMSCSSGSCVCDPAACGDLGIFGACSHETAVNQITYTSFQYPITDFGGLIASIAAILFPTGIGLGFFMIIRAGYKYMISEGDPAKVKEAQEELTAAIIGTLFILLSVFILNTIISTVLGVN